MTNDALADRLAITDVLLSYFRGLDRADWALTRSCFADDSHLDYPDAYVGGPDGFIDWVSAPSELGDCTQTLHFAGNMVIAVDGDRARSEVYAMAHHTAHGAHPWAGRFVVMWIRYLDRLERRAAGWQIVHREAVVEWIRDEPESVLTPGPTASRRDRTDPLYR